MSALCPLLGRLGSQRIVLDHYSRFLRSTLDLSMSSLQQSLSFRASGSHLSLIWLSFAHVFSLHLFSYCEWWDWIHQMTWREMGNGLAVHLTLHYRQGHYSRHQIHHHHRQEPHSPLQSPIFISVDLFVDWSFFHSGWQISRPCHPWSYHPPESLSLYLLAYANCFSS